MIEFGDASEKGSLYKPGLFGDKECTTQDLYAKSDYLDGFAPNKPGVTLPLISYKYLDVISYPVTVIARNPVSELSFTFAVKVNDLQCDPPLTSFDTSLSKTVETAKEKTPMRRCMKYNILTKAIRNCIKPKTEIDRSWVLHRVEVFNDTINEVIRPRILETIPIPGNYKME